MPAEETMKIFLDTANIDEIKRALEYGIIDGITTNPTLIAREKKEFLPLVKEITALVPGPVSVEVTALDSAKMVEEGIRYAAIAENVVIKVPITMEGLKAVCALSAKEIQTNVTLVFSANQALLAAKAGATFVSPFVGRLDDISYDGLDLIADISQIFDNYCIETEIIVASVRHPIHFLQAAKIGADIATIPFSTFAQLIKHPLTDSGIERFLKDWENVKK
jgi:transaldolase